MKQAIDLNIFNKQSGFGVSGKYKVINTTDIISRFQNAGFEVSRIAKARVKDVSKDGFQRHSIWFRHQKMLSGLRSNAIPEIQLLTSHDGTCAYRLYKALFRPVCSNGLVASVNHGVTRVIHVGDALTKAILAAEKLVSETNALMGIVERMERTNLSTLTAIEFARACSELVFPENVMFNASDLLITRREADEGSDLWTIFNVVQENLLKGGAKYIVNNEKGMQNRSLRKVSSLTRSIDINQNMFALAESMLKGA